MEIKYEVSRVEFLHEVGGEIKEALKGVKSGTRKRDALAKRFAKAIFERCKGIESGSEIMELEKMQENLERLPGAFDSVAEREFAMSVRTYFLELLGEYFEKLQSSGSN